MSLSRALRRLFIDLDGVLADFHTPLVGLYGLEPNALTEADWAQVGEWGLSVPKDDLWQRVQAAGAEFWAELPELPWTQELWAACRAACSEVIVLTTPGPFPESLAGKYAWVVEHLETSKMLIGSPKEACSKPGHVLIDDREGYRKRWEAEGGEMLTLQRPWSPQGDSPADVIAALRDFAARGASPKPAKT